MAEQDPIEPDPQEISGDEEATEQRPSSEEQLDTLRQLLVGRERSELETLRERLDSQEVSAQDISRALPQAVLLRTREDDQLSKALAPTIEGAIETSVKRNPGVLVDAIFPVIGPAIRKSIRETLSSMVESINRSVEHSFSPQGIRWRLEARRTGKPFAEIVLKHSLVYRVSEVFLIHRETALLLQHVTTPDVVSNDPDVISSVLGAIQAFVTDSFEEEGNGGIAQIEFGEQALLIASSPSATLACVVRGVSTVDLKQTLQKTLEQICKQLGRELREFDGDDSPFLVARGHLEGLLLERQVEPGDSKEKQQHALVRSWVWAIAIMALLLSIMNWIVSERATRMSWDAARHTLETTPGIVVTQHERDGDDYKISGLKDPLAANPEDLLAAAGLEWDSLETHFKPYLSLEDRIILSRARQETKAPDSVELAFDGGELTVSGHAPHAWFIEARERLEEVTGVRFVILDPLEDADQKAIDELCVAIQRLSVQFTHASDEVPSNSLHLGDIKSLIVALEARASSSGASAKIEVIGHTAADEDHVQGLAMRRAERVADQLRQMAPHVQFETSAGPYVRSAEVTFH